MVSMKTLFFIIPLLLAADCSDELLFRFFPQEFVLKALEAEGVPSPKAERIAKDLVERDREIVLEIEERGAKMAINPIQDPSQQQERADLFRTVIRQVFADALSKEGIANDEKADRALQAVQEMRLQQFESCQKKGALSP